jgi:hypothetical protein
VGAMAVGKEVAALAVAVQVAVAPVAAARVVAARVGVEGAEAARLAAAVRGVAASVAGSRRRLCCIATPGSQRPGSAGHQA